jgi:superfamily II DNA or RNA helicase
MTAKLDSLIHLPLANLLGGEIEQIKKALTITPKDFGTFGPAPTPIESFLLTEETLDVPVQWGLDFCHRKGWDIVNELNLGAPISIDRRPDPFHPKAPKGQKQFFDDVIAACESSCVVLACAPTGTGKTATGLNTLAHFGRAGIIIVHSKEIARQWREVEIPKHLGLRPDEVGSLEGDVIDYIGKKIVVAVIHNIIMKSLPQEFYDYFGFAAWDEGHKLGAPAFNESTRYFRAHKKLVLTATPNRKDGCMKLITNYFGNIRAKSESTPLTCTVRPIEYVHKRNYPPQLPRATLISAVSELEDRNDQLVTLILALYKAGRNFIGLSDRIPQLQTILEKLYFLGVPEEHLALYTRSYTDSNGKTKQTTAAELEQYRATARIFLATNQMAKEGLDIPRLDSGMCLSPSADGVQAIGRITRIYDNKPEPIWYVIRDANNPVLIRTYSSFMRSVRSLPHVKIVA